jgi:hypothetical protein
MRPSRDGVTAPANDRPRQKLPPNAVVSTGNDTNMLLSPAAVNIVAANSPISDAHGVMSAKSRATPGTGAGSGASLYRQQLTCLCVRSALCALKFDVDAWSGYRHFGC